MDNLASHMINNLLPHTDTNWRLKVRVTRVWQQLNRNAEIVGINMIFVDELVSSNLSTCIKYTLQTLPYT